MARPTPEQLKKYYEEGQKIDIEEEPLYKSPSAMVSWVWNEVKTFFEVMFATAWQNLASELPKLIGLIYEDINKLLNPPTIRFIDFQFDFLKTLGAADDDDIEGLRPIKDGVFPANLLASLMIWMTLMGGFMITKSTIILGTMRQTLNKIHSPDPPQPREVMPAAFIAPEKTGEVREAMQRAGLSEKDIDLMFLSAYRLYDENMIRTLWLRGVLNDDQMYMRMRELGYTDTRTKEMIQSWEIIPGPQDLFTLVAKEAFEPDMIEHIGLADEFPVDQVEWLKKQGISEDWAKKYWYAHWEQPSIQMGFDMLHRGIIDWKELDMLFRAVEVPPFWREKLTNVAFMPLTRVDVRRMHDLKVLNDQELVDAYMDLGYSEENAKRMGLFTIKYNQSHEKEVTMSQIIRGYKDLVMNKEDALELLIQIDYSRDQAEYLLLLEDYKIEKGYQDDLIKNLGDRYKGNLISEFDARGKMGQLNLPAKRVDLLIDTWNIDKFEDMKIPSKTDLDKFLKAKTIDEDTYRLEMYRLGYGYQYIGWYLDLHKKKRA